jgi:hypothetical protein
MKPAWVTLFPVVALLYWTVLDADIRQADGGNKRILTHRFINRWTLDRKMRTWTEVVFALGAIIGIGVAIAIAVAIGFCRSLQPTATAIATPIPIPTDRVFSSHLEAAKCQLTYELIVNF